MAEFLPLQEFSIIIPVYNTENNFKDVLAALFVNAIKILNDIHTGISYVTETCVCTATAFTAALLSQHHPEQHTDNWATTVRQKNHRSIGSPVCTAGLVCDEIRLEIVNGVIFVVRKRYPELSAYLSRRLRKMAPLVLLTDRISSKIKFRCRVLRLMQGLGTL